MVNSVVTAADRDLRARDKPAASITNAATLLPKSQKQQKRTHACEAAYPRYIGAYNPSPRTGRAGGADAYTPTIPHHHQPPREKLTLSLQWCSSVTCCCAGSSSAQFSSDYACLLSPFAYESMYAPDHHHAALTGLFLVWMLLPMPS